MLDELRHQNHSHYALLTSQIQTFRFLRGRTFGTICFFFFPLSYDLMINNIDVKEITIFPFSFSFSWIFKCLYPLNMFCILLIINYPE